MSTKTSTSNDVKVSEGCRLQALAARVDGNILLNERYNVNSIQLCMKQPPQRWSARAVSQFRQYHIAHIAAHTFGCPTTTHLMQFLIDACVLVCITIAMCGYNLLLTLGAAAYLKAMGERKFLQSENCRQFIGNVRRLNQNLTTYLWANKWMWRQKIKDGLGHWASMRIRSRTYYPIKIENKWFRTCRSSFRISSHQMYPMQANKTIAESMRTLNAHSDTKMGSQKAWRNTIEIASHVRASSNYPNVCSCRNCVHCLRQRAIF